MKKCILIVAATAAIFIPSAIAGGNSSAGIMGATATSIHLTATDGCAETWVPATDEDLQNSLFGIDYADYHYILCSDGTIYAIPNGDSEDENCCM